MPEELVPRTLSFLSFVIPVYNEQATLPYLRSQFEEWLPKFGERQYEIVLVDDGSRDASLVFCADWARDCPYVKVISFSRNFGHQPALSCGLSYASGEAVVILDADLQDPLSAVPAMIQRFEEGYDVAYGQRIARQGETVFKKVTAWAFYRIMQRCVYRGLPKDTGDFRLVSRRVVDIVKAMPEEHLFLRGMFAWVGFPQIAVPYVRDERRFGETKYPFSRMAKFAWSAITSFSALPIRLVSLWGACVGFLGFLICLYAFCSWLAGNVVQGWTSLIGVTALLGGSSIMAIGIVGEYVGNIFEEVKKRPKYIVSRVFNIGSPGKGSKTVNLR
ncbi:MAG: glycosyltransferase family 2 protein [Desulfovibrionaceae bacterium]|nr:glycosyltransferase family 2 protein [Desulfovibrionaceae bacterium]